MKVWLNYAATALALAFLVLLTINASWLTQSQPGTVKLIALRGIAQQTTAAGHGPQACAAAHIETPAHRFIENTIDSLMRARRMAPKTILMDVAATSDGHMVLFRDATLDCRTNGKGAVGDHSLAQLKALDAGYGYTADGGKTFPLRGKAIGAIPTVEEMLLYVTGLPLIYNLGPGGAADADLLAKALKTAGRDVEETGDGFTGSPAAMARITHHFPKAWAFSKESARACTSAYGWMGWLGMTPDACENGTLIVPLDRQWAVAGWPNRTSARMNAAGAKIIVVAASDQSAPKGLDLPEQLREIPAFYAGYVLTEDMWTLSPALHPSTNERNAEQEEATEKAVAARRAARQLR